ncbi:hypothetical protein BRADI_1g09830v3 [Brachypodium distachyon]|uniref:Uncharacterized protein n=1 Tax=Brachypodium distachyon TaxID=15368 RepID=I1GNP8_BRADI|nr:hypothetical protein BRADI_1g09830v3 [Brachypodium distachyon]
MSTTVVASGRGVRALAVLGRCVRAPFRALARARDMYVSACAGGGPAGMVAVPRSRSHVFYRSAGEDDDAELVRAASRAGPPRRPSGVGPRSQSLQVAIGRIEEDRPSDFGVDDGAVVVQSLGPRSRSCAVGSTAMRRRRVGGVPGA